MEYKIDYKQQGAGAVEIRLIFTSGLTLYEAIPVKKQLMKDDLHYI
ncbi:hypothetical protein [Peribacillus simplex]